MIEHPSSSSTLRGALLLSALLACNGATPSSAPAPERKQQAFTSAGVYPASEETCRELGINSNADIEAALGTEPLDDGCDPTPLAVVRRQPYVLVDPEQPNPEADPQQVADIQVHFTKGAVEDFKALTVGFRFCSCAGENPLECSQPGGRCDPAGARWIEGNWVGITPTDQWTGNVVEADGAGSEEVFARSFGTFRWAWRKDLEGGLFEEVDGRVEGFVATTVFSASGSGEFEDLSTTVQTFEQPFYERITYRDRFDICRGIPIVDCLHLIPYFDIDPRDYWFGHEPFPGPGPKDHIGARLDEPGVLDESLFGLFRHDGVADVRDLVSEQVWKVIGLKERFAWVRPAEGRLAGNGQLLALAVPRMNLIAPRPLPVQVTEGRLVLANEQDVDFGSDGTPELDQTFYADGSRAVLSSREGMLFMVGGVRDGAPLGIRRWDLASESWLPALATGEEPAGQVLAATYGPLARELYVLDLVEDGSTVRLSATSVQEGEWRELWRAPYEGVYEKHELVTDSQGQLQLFFGSGDAHEGWRIDPESGNWLGWLPPRRGELAGSPELDLGRTVLPVYGDRLQFEPVLPSSFVAEPALAGEMPKL